VVCWRLGLKYLWIDALCILQDDTAGLDWYEQSAEMDQIYSCAHIVIAADVASDCSSGFLKSTGNQRYQEIEVDRSDGTSWICRERPNGQREDPRFLLTRTPLSHRAWTLQETLLPARVLHYTGSELVLRVGNTFECQCGGCCFEQISLDKAHWHQIVSHYSARHISKPSDKLSALSGLAARIAKNNGNYLAGLWLTSLKKDMLWYVSGDGPHKRAGVWRAPTWSWASIDGGVNYFSRFDFYDFHSAIDIVKAECTALSVDAFGQISAGFVELRGHLVQVEMVILDQPFVKHQGEYNGEWGRAVRVHQGQTSLVRGWSTGIYEVLCDERLEVTDNLNEWERNRWAKGRSYQPDSETLGNSKFYCLEIGSVMDFEREDENDDFMPLSSRVWWLVLRQRDKNNNDEFERVGIGYKSSKDFKRDCDLFDSAEGRTIRLV
jgi:heterokaryon incompatibility protein (HET)